MQCKLVGIVCTQPDYKLAWLLNQHLGIRLEKEEDLSIMLKNGYEVYIARFEAFDPLNRIVYTLLENKSGGHCLIHEMKQMDYLLMISDAIDFFDLKTTLQQLKGIKEITWIAEIDLAKIKSKSLLILPETKRYQQYKTLLT